MGVPGLLKVLKNQGLFPRSRVQDCDHLYVDVAGELHLVVDRYKGKPEGVQKAFRQRLRQLFKNHKPKKSLYLAFDGPAPLLKAMLQTKRRLRDARNNKGRSSMAITPGCTLMAAMHHAARLEGEAWLRRVPHGEFILSSSNVPGEGELKAFSALRVRLREAEDRAGGGPQGEKHVVLCADSDAVVMALMLDPRTDVTINLGAQYGLLHVKDLRQRWLQQPLRNAGLDLGKDHQITLGYTQDFALLTIMQYGNDYLPAQALNVLRGPNARGTYLEMRKTKRWKDRTLLVVDRQRRMSGFDVEFLLHLLLDIFSRQSRLRRRQPVEDTADDALGDSGKLAPVLQEALQHVTEDATFPDLRFMDAAVWRQWKEAMPANLQLQELVKAATEPRVAALGVDLLAKGGKELGRASKSKSMSQSDAVRQSLSLFKSPTQPAASRYLTALRWCVELYGFSTCMNFRLASNPKGDAAGVSSQQGLGRLISHLALGWARHIASTHTPDASDSLSKSNLRSAHAVLNNCDAWRLAHTEPRVGRPLWPRAMHGAKQPHNVAAVNGRGVAASVAAGLSVDVCTPGALCGEQMAAECTFQQCDAGAADKHPEATGLGVEVVPRVLQAAQAGGRQGNGAEGTLAAPVLLLVPGYGNESTVGGEWMELHDVKHNGLWREEVEGSSTCCTWSQASPVDFCNSQADEFIKAMHQAALARAHPPSDTPTSVISSSEAQRRVLQCALLSYDLPEVAIPAMLRSAVHAQLSGNDQQLLLRALRPHHKDLLHRLQAEVQAQDGDKLDGHETMNKVAHLLTQHYLQLGSQVFGGSGKDGGGVESSVQVDLPVSLWQPVTALSPTLRAKLSEHSPLSPAAHGTHVTPRSALHLLTEDTQRAISQGIDDIKPECTLCDQLHNEHLSAKLQLHSATVYAADTLGSWRLLDVLVSSTGRILGELHVEASSGTRKRKAVTVDQLFHQGAVDFVAAAEGGKPDAGRKIMRSAMHDCAGTSGSSDQQIDPGAASTGSEWIRLPGCSMQVSFCALDALQDMYIPVGDTGSLRAKRGSSRPGVEDNSAGRWCSFGHWNATRCAVMGAGSAGSCSGARMHLAQVVEALLLGAWKLHESSPGLSSTSSSQLFTVAATIGFGFDTAQVVLAALPHMRAVAKSRCSHEQSLRVLAVAFSLSFALRVQAAEDVEQANAELKHSRLYLRATDIASVTHRRLSHSGHDGSVPAIEKCLAEADLAGPTATCTLAQACWTAQEKVENNLNVTHTGLAVKGISVARGSAAFAGRSSSGLVALHPTAVKSTNGHDVEECFVVDEQARRLTAMYLRDAANRSARSKRAREASAESCVSGAAPRVLFMDPGPEKHISTCKGWSVTSGVCRHGGSRGSQERLRCSAWVLQDSFRASICRSQTLQRRSVMYSTVKLKVRGVVLR